MFGSNRSKTNFKRPVTKVNVKFISVAGFIIDLSQRPEDEGGSNNAKVSVTAVPT